ncbi:MAG: hypothetical protein ACK4I8_07245 [Armatimonadota bacterium]
MRGLAGLLCLLFLLGIGNAQDGTLRVIVRDEHARPIQAIAQFHPQIYDFCTPWDTFTLSSWHSLFLSYARELGREPSLIEWREWLVKMGMATREQTKMVTDENGQIAWSVRPGIYSVYAWSPGYGVACAHHILVRPEETTEVVLNLSRVPITMLQAHLVFPSPPLTYSSLRLMQNGVRLFTHYLLSDFLQFPLAQWHPRSPNPLFLGELTAVFEADGAEARKSFRVEKWGEVVNLGTIEFSPRPPKPETGKKITVTIQVFWSDGKTPAEGVAVNYINVMTDQQGRVQLELTPGGNEVRVYVPKQFWHKGISSFHWFYITPETEQVKIVLPKPAKVQGLVRYENGVSAVNAEVSMDLLWGGAEHQLPELRTRTDEKGAFSFPAVSPGRFILRVQDGLISFSRFISIKSGQDIHLTVNLRPPQTRLLTGEIKLPLGEPASKAAVMMLAMELLFADEQGRFTTKRGITEEPLFVWVPGKGSAFRWLLIPPSPEPLALSVMLENGCILGRVVDEHNRPVPMASVKLLQGGFYFTGLLAAHTDAEGMFRISPVPSGEWDLVIEGPPISLMPPIPALVRTISVPPNGIVDVGTVKLSTKVGRIVGRVVFPNEFGKGEGQSTVRIYLQPESWSAKWMFEEVSRSNPGFYCFPLPPGNYWLLAQGGGWSSPPQKVNIPETGGDVSVTIPLRKAGSLRVFVYDGKTEKPIEASAGVVNAEGVEFAFKFTDTEGEALLENIPPGRHVLQVWRVLYRPVKLPVRIIAGQVGEVTVRLEPKF